MTRQSEIGQYHAQTEAHNRLEYQVVLIILTTQLLFDINSLTNFYKKSAHLATAKCRPFVVLAYSIVFLFSLSFSACFLFFVFVFLSSVCHSLTKKQFFLFVAIPRANSSNLPNNLRRR